MEEPVERLATATGNGPVRPVAEVFRFARASPRAARFDQSSARRRASSTTSYTLLGRTAAAWLSTSAPDTPVRSKALAGMAPSSREVKARFGANARSGSALAGHGTVRAAVGENASAAASWQDEHARCATSSAGHRT